MPFIKSIEIPEKFCFLEFQIEHYTERLKNAVSKKEIKFLEEQLTGFLTTKNN
jgi:hypothetical protein